MLKRILAGVTTLALALGMVALASVPASAAPKGGPIHNGEKVTICHSPSSATNPWVVETPSVNSMKDPTAGHLDPSTTDTHADDIIPAFWYDVHDGPDWSEAYFPGKNLTTVFNGYTGAQILANDCKIPTPTPVAVSVSGSGSPETCSTGQVVGGSILLTVVVGGAPVTLPAAGVTVTVTGPGYAGAPVTSNTLTALADGVYTFQVSVGSGKTLSTPASFSVTVGDSGSCVVIDDDPVTVAAQPSPEVCDDGDVVGGSIALTVTIDGVPTAIPATGVVVTVQGPGFAVPTTVTSGTLNDLADGVYTFTVTVGAGLKLTSPAEFSSTVADSGDCTLPPTVAVTGTPVDESCNVIDGVVVPGSITLTVVVDGTPVTLPADGVTITVDGPGHPAGTPVTSNTVSGLADGTYTFTVVVDGAHTLTTTSPFSRTVGDFDTFDCLQLVDHPLVVPSVTFTEPTCAVPTGSYALSNDQTLPGALVPAVFWTVDGVANVAEGSYSAPAGSTVKISVAANGPDYGFSVPSPIVYPDHTFADAPVCGDLTTLALTGQEQPAPLLVLAGFLGLLGIALARAGVRVGRRTES